MQYAYSEAVQAGLTSNDTWKKYADDMLYWKCLARARKQVCPEVLEGVPFYEDYKELESSSRPTDGEVIDAEVVVDSLEDKIRNAETMDELEALLPEIRRSKKPSVVGLYAGQKRYLEDKIAEDDAKEYDANEADATNIGE